MRRLRRFGRMLDLQRPGKAVRRAAVMRPAETGSAVMMRAAMAMELTRSMEWKSAMCRAATSWLPVPNFSPGGCCWSQKSGVCSKNVAGGGLKRILSTCSRVWYYEAECAGAQRYSVTACGAGGAVGAARSIVSMWGLALAAAGTPAPPVQNVPASVRRVLAKRLYTVRGGLGASLRLSRCRYRRWHVRRQLPAIRCLGGRRSGLRPSPQPNPTHRCCS